jgi:3D (Asp-Asp-Asp) domain-containing protein
MNKAIFILGAVIGLLVGATMLQPTEAKPEPEIKTEYKTIIKTATEKEYIKINQTEPMEMTVTAYTAGPESTGKRPGDKGYGITFAGTQARTGVCATDPDYIPLGTSLFVEGYGYCHAEDIGGAVKGYHVDVFMEDLNEALEFGREKRKVWILSNYEEEEPDADQGT